MACEAFCDNAGGWGLRIGIDQPRRALSNHKIARVSRVCLLSKTLLLRPRDKMSAVTIVINQ